MAIEVFCSQCSGKFAVAERHAGKLAKCPKCSQQISIPHLSATAANLVAEPRAEEVLVATEVAPAAKVTPAKATQPTAAPQQFEDREALAREVLGAFQGSIAPVKTALSYKLGVAAVSLVMLMLPLVYISLIVLVGYGVYLHLIHDTGLLTASGSGKAKMAAFFIYIAPLFIGGTLIFFMIKPLFAPSGQRRGTRSLTRDGEPLLFAFVDRICDAVGSARPRRIDVDSDVNASASFRNGMLSMFSNDLVLTIGVPLAAGLTMREFAGVLAHEFGHFSQGAGMRLSYLIRTINNWFQRVVYQRDSWDEWLAGTASSVDLRLGIFLYATMFMVWLTRKILWALMMVGHFVSSFFSREMEFDADRYEARLAGGDSFESCMRRITILSVAHQGAESDLRDFMREGRLGDNLPKLVIANVEQIPADVKKKIDQHIDTVETGWFDTHPCSKERIASAHREQAAGIFRLEYPASALFAHFEILSKNVTWDLYRAVFGQTVSQEELHNTDDLVARLNKNQQNNQAIERYCQGCFTLLRKLQLPTTAPSVSRNPKLTLEALKQYRAKMLAEVDNYSELLKQYDEADTHLLQAKQAKELLYAQISLKQADFKIPVGSTTTAVRARDEAEGVQGRLDAKMLVCEKMLGERLYAALELLPVPQVAARIENAAQLQTETENYYEALVALMSQLGAITKLRDERSALGALCSYLKDSHNSEALISSILNVLKEVFRQTTELRAELVRVPYPFDHARGPIDVGHYCIKELPLSDDLGGVYNAAGELLEGVTQIYIRLLGNLVTAAESVETAVGLPKLEPRVPAEKS